MNIEEDKIMDWIKTNTGITDGFTTKNVSLAGLKNILVKYHESELNSLRLDFVSNCDCSPLVACEICGEEKNLDGDFWKNKKKHDKPTQEEIEEDCRNIPN